MVPRAAFTPGLSRASFLIEKMFSVEMLLAVKAAEGVAVSA
jgi:hypothetical protein